MGCHGSYDDRYPEDAAVFDGSTVTGAYDDAVRYNDAVMRDLYEHARAIPGFRDFTFFSDHGESVETNAAHDPGLFEPDMTYIPLYILPSGAARTAKPQPYAALRANAEKPWTNDLAYEPLITRLGLTPPHAVEPENDLASPDYDGDITRLRTCYGEREIAVEE